MSELSMTQEPLAQAAAVDRRFFVFTAVVSVAALSLLGWLLMVRDADVNAGVQLRFMPAVNASLNALSASFLVSGYVFIRRKNWQMHQRAMIAAFASSALFLVGYLAYHYVHGDTKYVGTGVMRSVYFFVLVSHIVLSAFVLPMALVTFYWSFTRRLEKHRKLARWTLPIWLYVSVTGVLIYFLLRGSVPAVP